MTWHAGLQIKDVMTTQVITIAPDDVMEKVRDIFEHYNIHHVPVVKLREVVGIISREDYFRIIHGFCMHQSHKNDSYNDALLRSLLVEEVMSQHVITLKPEDALAQAADFFRKNAFHAIPVVDEQHGLVGIITTYDLINCAFQQEARPDTLK